MNYAGSGYARIPYSGGPITSAVVPTSTVGVLGPSVTVKAVLTPSFTVNAVLTPSLTYGTTPIGG